jgi:hypothetical protein
VSRAATAEPRPLTEIATLGETAMAPRTDSLDLVAVARDPNVSVEKLERLMAMQERLANRAAEQAFNAAMAEAQTRMRPVAADASNPQTRSRYASYAALDVKLRPLYTDAGFGLSFDTGESPIADHLRVLCYVTHRDGFARTYHVDMPNDGKGAKGGDVMTKTHATGAAMTYGMRYLLKMIFNVAVGEDDTDGNEPEDVPADPKGFEEWFDGLDLVAADGTARLQDVWKQSPQAFRDHVFKAHRRSWEVIKAKAAKVKTDA